MVKIILAVVFLVSDRLTKWYILHHPNFDLGDFIRLKLTKNTSFYFIELGKSTNLALLLAGAVILGLLVFLFFKIVKKNHYLAFGLSLIILGGASNLFDRLYYGFVIDWIRIFILPISIFNFADIMIISGVLLTGLMLVFHKKIC